MRVRGHADQSSPSAVEGSGATGLGNRSGLRYLEDLSDSPEYVGRIPNREGSQYD